MRDLRYALRVLIKAPGFTAVAVLTLMLGIGANTAIFSVVNAVLLRPLPYPDPDRLVTLWEVDRRGRSMSVSNPNFQDWRQQAQSFAHVAAYQGMRMTVAGGSEPDQVPVAAVTQGFFEALSVNPVVGRTFLPAENQPGGSGAVVVSYDFWRNRLGGDPNLKGKILRLAGRSLPVVGVMPPGFSFPFRTAVWGTREVFPDPSRRTAHNLRVIARLRNGVGLEQAGAEMNTIARRLHEEYAGANDAAAVAVTPLHEQVVATARPALLVLLGAVGLVLLIACANVANLLLAQSASRQKEIAIRAALGAGRFRVIRQLLGESVLLAMLGGGLGLLFSLWSFDALIRLAPSNIPRLNEAGIDARVLGFTLAASVLTGILFGLAPALRLSRTNLVESLRVSASPSLRVSASGLLVVAEVALALVLAVGAGLMMKSFRRLLEVHPGFNPEKVLVAELSVPESAYFQDIRIAAVCRQLVERMGTMPGATAVGLINPLPMGGDNRSGSFFIEGRPGLAGSADYRVASAGYFRTLEIPLVKGRLFRETDDRSAPVVVVISQTMAKRFWPEEDPLGRRFRFAGMEMIDVQTEAWLTVVGVVGDVRHSGLDRDTAPEVYVHYLQRPSGARNVALVIRTAGDPAGLVAAVRAAVRSVDTELPVNFRTMDQVFRNSFSNRRFNMLLLSLFGGLALVLAAVGIYGVMAYSVTQRTGEIGIRMALGAQQTSVLGLVLKQGLRLALAGVGIGVVAGLALTRVISTLLFGVKPADPMTFLTVSILLTLVAALACYLPARRAAKLDPMLALRQE